MLPRHMFAQIAQCPQRIVRCDCRLIGNARNPRILQCFENFCQTFALNILEQYEAMRKFKNIRALYRRRFEALAAEQIADLLAPRVRRKNLNTDAEYVKNFLRQICSVGN